MPKVITGIDNSDEKYTGTYVVLQRSGSMKFVLFLLLITMFFIGCSGPPNTASYEIKVFPAQALEIAVKRALQLESTEVLRNEYLQEIKKLDARNLGITSISGLEDLTSLKYLYLSENEIKDIGPISSLTNLRYLYLSGNVIEDISPIQNLNGLRVLFLRDNQIKDITPISSLENIGVIYLRNNSIEDISPLVENDSLTEVWIWLEGNPLSDISISRDIQILQRRDVQVSYTPRK